MGQCLARALGPIPIVGLDLRNDVNSGSTGEYQSPVWPRYHAHRIPLGPSRTIGRQYTIELVSGGNGILWQLLSVVVFHLV
jgi:hypothetical protein